MANISLLSYPYFTDNVTQLNAINLNTHLRNICHVVCQIIDVYTEYSSSFCRS